MTVQTHRRLDWSGFAGCALAIAIGVAALLNSGDFSPLGSVFPRTIAVLMIVLSLLYIGLSWRGARRVVLTQAEQQPGLEQQSQPAAHEAASATPASTPRRVGVMVVLLVWAFLLAPLGFLFTSACASVALLLIAQHDRWTARRGLVQAASTMLVLGGLYALFRFVLQVPLPVGVFW